MKGETERFDMKKLIESVSDKTVRQFKKSSVYRTIETYDTSAFLKNDCKIKYYNSVLYWAAPEYGAFIEAGDDWQSMKDHSLKLKKEGCIYLIKLSETLFKFGRTSNMRKRFNEYPRGAELIKYDYVSDMIEAEKILLNCAEESNGKHDIGNEYYKFDNPNEPLEVYNKALSRIPI